MKLREIRKEVINIADLNTYRFNENTKNKDWGGNKRTTYAQLGASNHTEDNREENDFYATEPKAADILIKDTCEDFTNNIYECAAGEGHLAKKFIELGYNVHSTELVDRGYGITGVDFLKVKREDIPFKTFSIVTNPPYSKAEDFIYHAMDILKDGEKCVMFLKVLFEESDGRKSLFKKYPPRIYICSNRIKCAKNGDFYDRDKETGEILYKKDGTPKFISSAVAYAWYVFEKGWKPKEGGGIIDWVN